MTAASTGAVFFLGTRAHYQVLQQPESRYDVENGNTSTESIYQKAAMDSSGNYIGERNLAYCDSVDNVTEEKEKEVSNGIKRRSNRRQSETTLCDRDIDMKPALLNHLRESETLKKPSRRRINLMAFLASLGRRKPRLHADSVQYLQHLESALTACTYRESCRCLECQSSYFDCDESEFDSECSEYDYDYNDYDFTTQYVVSQESPQAEEDDDEVFVDPPPTDTTSTDLLLEPARQPSDSVSDTDSGREDGLQLEVAAGTPVLTDYLLSHPVTCCIQ